MCRLSKFMKWIEFQSLYIYIYATNDGQMWYPLPAAIFFTFVNGLSPNIASPLSVLFADDTHILFTAFSK